MRILIITTHYPPDTAIAAVRPYMLAKYLNNFGHEITVLRSGFLSKSADRSYSDDCGIRVVTYLGDSPAERFERSEEAFMKIPPGKSRISFLPERIRLPIAKLYHKMMAPFDMYKRIKTRRNLYLTPLKQKVDLLKQERFDVVFSTYGDIENIYGGKYAAQRFGCKWILDFRDPVTSFAAPFTVNIIYRFIQSSAIRAADACTAVSDDLAAQLSACAAGKEVHTIYNGYEEIVDEERKVKRIVKRTVDSCLSFCFTGTLHGTIRDFSPLFEAINVLVNKGDISLDNVRFYYAGNEFQYLFSSAQKHGVESILINCGYIGRKETYALQKGVDFFLVANPNTKMAQGGLSGKFCEGIRCSTPILSIISGDVPNSELYRINERFHYGFCYEMCRREELFPQLCDYLAEAWRYKQETGKVPYNPTPDLATHFRYDTQARRLEEICKKFVKE